jgi:hypothetical protein
VRTCADCGVELHDLDAPCPACGSTRQNATIRGSVGVGAGAGRSGGFTIGYGPDRPWYVQWRSVRQHLEIVESDCRPGAYRGNEPVRLDFENFFTQCLHLGDWLWEDKTTGAHRNAGTQVHRKGSSPARLRWHGKHEQAPYAESSERPDSEDRQRHVRPERNPGEHRLVEGL